MDHSPWSDEPRMPPEQSVAELVVEVVDFLPSRFEITLVPNSGRTELCEVVCGRARQSALSSFTNDLLALCGVMSAYLDEPTLRRRTSGPLRSQEVT
jgi:hypothetical protein